jgi:hypothetical protein
MTFLRPLRVVATVAVLAVLGVACGDEEDGGGLSASASQSASQSASASEGSSGSMGTSVGSTGTPGSSSSSSGDPTTGGPDTTTANPTTTPDSTSSSTSDATTGSPGSTSGQGGCGDGVINGNEQCDGANLNGFTCEALGNAGGTLLCDPVTCTFDTQMCEVGGSGGTSG